MKIHALIVLLISTLAAADLPRDFVRDDALAVLSIQNGEAINSTLRTIQKKSDIGLSKPNVIDFYLGQFIKDTSAIDLTSEILLIIEPMKRTKGQRPSGMFGPMPNMVVICKPKKGRTIELAKSSSLKTTAVVDGWFVATGADSWSPKSSTNPSPILAKLPDTQISSIVEFGAFWKQFRPIVQMLGGMYIGSMNRPGPDGVITSERKNATSTASKGFKALTGWCSAINNITLGMDFDRYTLITNIDVIMKEPKNPVINNDSIHNMSELLSDTMVQYALSGKLRRKLLELDVESLWDLSDSISYGGASSFVTIGLKILAEYADDNVGAYGLNKKNGLTISCLSEVTNQDGYLAALPNYFNEIATMLLDEYRLKLTNAKKPNTWDVSMVGTDSEDQRIINTVIHKGALLKFVKQGDDRIAMAFGPKRWKALNKSHPTPLSRVISDNANTVDIDFALSFDARKFIVGFVDVAKEANLENDISVSSSPSAKSSLLFGTTVNGTHIEIKTDLLGSATLIAEIDKEKAKAKM